METRPINIFEKVLYAVKVSNDNIVVMNEKLDILLNMLTAVEDPAPSASSAELNGSAQTI